MNGNVKARHNLGCLEKKAGNNNRAKKHFILAAKAGFKKSLDAVKIGFMEGCVTKDFDKKKSQVGRITLDGWKKEQMQYCMLPQDET